MNGGRDPVEDDACSGTERLPLGLSVPGSRGMVSGDGVKCTGADRVRWSEQADLGRSPIFTPFLIYCSDYFQVTISVSCAACLHQKWPEMAAL